MDIVRIQRAGSPVRFFTAVLLAVGLSALTVAASDAGAASKKTPTPMIFVHGQSGSAQQFESNAMRFDSNGFPKNRIFAYEYDTNEATNDLAIAGLDLQRG